jgi:transcriptional regulator with XRE-family HTH domain
MLRSPATAQPSAVSAREALALNMIRLRSELGWSQEDLAYEAGLHRTFVAHVERQARNISIDNVQRLAEALGLQAYQLLTPTAKVKNAAQ